MKRYKEKLKIIDVVLLVGIIFFAMFISYIPHLNYQYPLHVDEWHHITIAKQIAKAGNFNIEPFTGKLIYYDFEIGYHLLLVFIQKITNLDIILIPVFFPSIFTAISVFSVFLLTRRWGKKTALISSLLTALIPSNITIGGPSLLLPLNLTLILIPISLLIVFNAKNIKHYFILFLIIISVLFSHPPTALIIYLLVGVYLLLNIRTDRKKTYKLFIVLLLPLVIYSPYILYLFKYAGSEVTIYTFWVWLSKIPDLFGFIQTVFFILGFYLLATHGKKEDWTILLGITSFLILIFFYIQTGWLPLFSYHRIYMPLFILMVLVTGYGISKIKSKNILLIVLSVIVVLSLQQHFSTPYYHVIDDNDYRNFIWIRDNTSPNTITLLDPWKARAFPAIAERRVFTVTPFGPNQEVLKINQKAYDFFNGNCTNTTFLIENNISVIYSLIKCQNDNLTEMKDSIYFLK